MLDPNDFKFKWNEADSLLSELKKPIRQISYQIYGQGMLSAIALWQDDEQGVLIYSQMHDVNVDERHEIGVLGFEKVQKSATKNFVFATVPGSGYSVIEVFKLLIDEPEVVGESGIALELHDGQTLIVVADSFPCNISVSKGFGGNSDFNPEYPIELYRRVEFTQEA